MKQRRFSILGLFTINGRFIANVNDPSSSEIHRLRRIWAETSDTVVRPIVYVRGAVKLCAGCRAKRYRTDYQPTMASQKEYLVRCNKCGRKIYQNDENEFDHGAVNENT